MQKAVQLGNFALINTNSLCIFSSLLKCLIFLFLFFITAACVVPCGGSKKTPRTHLQCRLYFDFGPLRSKKVF